MWYGQGANGMVVGSSEQIMWEWHYVIVHLVL